ncbi:hypothetical protein NEDG_02113 [Nematocida displodere]|uniref:RING-type domain-containing protein n=1 Tax=Nematocida displodere TaxID=1805483 RepID=A0A177EJN0_9MICR|nr:hypothetical protein NEDG_02113 [Nematocida displodere]
MKFVSYLKKTHQQPRNSAAFCLLVLTIAVHCAEETAPNLHPDHILSPYTEQTLKFFSQSYSQQRPNNLKTGQRPEQAQILRKQTRPIHIILENYTLDLVPEKLAQGIEFSTLLLISTPRHSPNHPEPLFTPTRTSTAVLQRILSALGTICADSLEFHGVKVDFWSSIESMAQRLGRAARGVGDGLYGLGMLDQATVPTRHSHSIKGLKIIATTVSSIKWVQKHLDMSQCRINLAIWGLMDLDSLELVDGFNVAGVEELFVNEVLSLSSLECKLLREGPLPSVLVIESPFVTPFKISEKIIHQIVNNHWKLLRIHKCIWKRLMKPTKDTKPPKHLSADTLVIDMSHFSGFHGFYLTPLPPMGNNQAIVKHLILSFHKFNSLIDCADIVRTLEWTSRHFRGLEKVRIGNEAEIWRPAPFVIRACVLLLTSPGLTSVRIANVECALYQKTKGTILGFSLEAWDFFKTGKLWDELCYTSQIMMGFLSPDIKEIIKNQDRIDDTDALCSICMNSLDELKQMKYPIPVEVCVLDKAMHTVCSICLSALTKGSGPLQYIPCPICRGRIGFPFLRNKIKRNAGGRYYLLMGVYSTEIDVLSFPSNCLGDLLRGAKNRRVL